MLARGSQESTVNLRLAYRKYSVGMDFFGNDLFRINHLTPVAGTLRSINDIIEHFQSAV